MRPRDRIALVVAYVVLVGVVAFIAYRVDTDLNEFRRGTCVAASAAAADLDATSIQLFELDARADRTLQPPT